MVGLSTKARLTSASSTPSPCNTARAVSRMRARSTSRSSCGLAMLTRIMKRAATGHQGQQGKHALLYHLGDLGALGGRFLVETDHVGLAALINGDPGGEHG